MGLLIDSNVWIASERGKFSMVDFLSAWKDEPVVMASITASELLYCVHRATDPLIREKRQAFVTRILESVPIIAFDSAIARLHAALCAEAGQKGRNLGSHDLIIAATALHSGYRLVSFNEREFKRVPGLSVIVP